jgi:hypothetical protein
MAESIVQDRMRAEAGRTPPKAGSDGSPPKTGSRATRIVLGTLTMLVSVNLWTGGPLLALWVGSRIQAAVGQLSMAAVGATLGVLILETFLLYKALAFLNARYNRAIGRTVKRQQTAWLKPMSGERRSLRVTEPLTAVERIVVVSVTVAFEAAVVWFFFLAHYTLLG